MMDWRMIGGASSHQVMFREREAYHSVYRLLERDSQVCLTEHQELHLLEIPKFHREPEALREPLDFWLYFLQNGKDLDADALPGPLARPDICQAMEVLKVFSQSELERDRYENRLKAQRDLMSLKREREDAVRERDDAVRERDATVREREDAVRERNATARERDATARERDEFAQERDEAILQRDVAQQELARARQQILASRIQLCQKLLGQSPTPCDKLMAESPDNLQMLAEKLERQLPESL